MQPIEPLINTVCDYAYQYGLPNTGLAILLDIVRKPNSFDQTSLTTLIKGLYPAEKVLSESVCKVVAALGQGQQKPSAATQNLLLWWLLSVRSSLEEWAILEKLYAVLFNLLDMISIRYSAISLLGSPAYFSEHIFAAYLQ